MLQITLCCCIYIGKIRWNPCTRLFTCKLGTVLESNRPLRNRQEVILDVDQASTKLFDALQAS